jgi:hypothetical protein
LIKSAEISCSGGNERTNTITGVVKECVFRGEDYKLSLVLDDEMIMNFNRVENHQAGEKIRLMVNRSSIICLEKKKE